MDSLQFPYKYTLECNICALTQKHLHSMAVKGEILIIGEFKRADEINCPSEDVNNLLISRSSVSNIF